MNEKLDPRVTLEERSVELQRAKQKRPQNSIPKMQTRVTLEERFVELQSAKQKSPQNSIPKVQWVANHLRNRNDFAKHYFPKFLSIGPIHHGDPRLRQGEKYKLIWAKEYIESTDQTPQILHNGIADNNETLKDLFAEDVLTNNKWFDNYTDEGFHHPDEKLLWMLFVDGCSLLHILEKANFDKLDQLNVKVDQLVLVIQDVLLLENQLPYLVLKTLWRRVNDDSTLIETMENFLRRCHHWTINNYDLRRWNQSYHTPTHLLDLQRSIFILSAHPKRAPEMVPRVPTLEHNNDNNSRENNSDVMVTFRNIQELRATGIRLKSSKTRRPRDISFSHGWLFAEMTLPEIVVDDTTAATFLNLTAYEMCPDFENDYGICSFAAFMDSLIDHPEDVKALRSAGILINSLGSDEEVANLFNIICSDLVSDMQAYSKVRDQIEKHYKKKWKTWIAMVYHTHFSNPWAIITFFAALFALFLTSVQTWFTVYPDEKKKG